MWGLENRYQAEASVSDRVIGGLADMGMFSCVRLDWVSASEGNKFVSIVNDMTAKLKELGPLAKS